LEDYFKTRCLTVRQYTGLSSILVTNLWWDCKSNLFRDKNIPQINLILSNEFKEELKLKISQEPYNARDWLWDTHGDFDKAWQGHPLVFGDGILLFMEHNQLLDMLREFVPIIDMSLFLYKNSWKLLSRRMSISCRLLEIWSW